MLLLVYVIYITGLIFSALDNGLEGLKSSGIRFAWRGVQYLNEKDLLPLLLFVHLVCRMVDILQRYLLQ